MNILTRPGQLLLLLLGVTAFMSVQCLGFSHMRNAVCPPITKFPAMVKVTLNISSQDSPLQSGDIRKRSTSPWDYSYDKNINRHPVVIAEAKCDIAGCVDAEGKVDNSLNSVPIYQEILVIHREMKGCAPVFRLEKKIVTVGCTCERPVNTKQKTT